MHTEGCRPNTITFNTLIMACAQGNFLYRYAYIPGFSPTQSLPLANLILLRVNKPAPSLLLHRIPMGAGDRNIRAHAAAGFSSALDIMAIQGLDPITLHISTCIVMRRMIQKTHTHTHVYHTQSPVPFFTHPLRDVSQTS